MPDPTDRRVRLATLADLEILVYQRCAMFRETGSVEADELPALEQALRVYIRRALPAGEFAAWLAEDDGRVVSGGGVYLRNLMPRPAYVHQEREALIVSMWTEPSHRRRGYARAVLDAIVAWCHANDHHRITLHASSAGRPLYEKAGFQPTNEMRLELR